MRYLEEPTFDQLRTKEQLGYVVSSRTCTTRDIVSAGFLIQSPHKNCLQLRARLDVHLAKMRIKMQNLSDEDFVKIVGSINTIISEKDKSLKEEFDRFWVSEIASHKYKFDRQDS